MFNGILNAIQGALRGIGGLFGGQQAPRAPTAPQQAPQAPVAPPPQVAPQGPQGLQLSQLTSSINQMAGLYPSFDEQIARNQQAQQQVQQQQAQKDLHNKIALNTLIQGLGYGPQAVQQKPVQSQPEAGNALTHNPIYATAESLPIPLISDALRFADPAYGKKNTGDFIQGIAGEGLGAPTNLGGQIAAQITGQPQKTLFNDNIDSFTKTSPLETAGNILGTAGLLAGTKLPVGEGAEAPVAKVPETAPVKAPPAPTAPVVPEAKPAQGFTQEAGKAPEPTLPTPKNAYDEASNELRSVNPDGYSTARVGGTQVVQGRVEAGQIIADRLVTQVTKDLPDIADRKLLGDYLDDPTIKVSPKVKAVADQVRPLLNQAAAIRTKADMNFNPVSNYFTRAMRGDTDYRGPQFDTATPSGKSQYNLHRDVNRFVNDDTGDAYVGAPKELGLKEDSSTGKYTNQDGNSFTRQQATRQELRDIGVPLEDDAAKTLGKYFADTNRIKEHSFYLEGIKNAAGIDPATASAEQLTQAAADGYRTVKTKGLEGVLFPGKTADALEGMTAQGPQNILARAFRGLTAGLRNIAVTNPVVHPLNIETQAAIGAGHPGEALMMAGRQVADGLDFHSDPVYLEMKRAGGTGMGLGGDTNLFRKIAKNIAPNSERAQDIAGGLDSQNIVAWNRKIVEKADESARLGLYKELKSQGLKPKEAVARINKFLGDYGNGLGKNESAISNVAFFYRWLKTEVTSLQQTGTDVLQGHPESLITMATIGAGLVAADKAYQNYTQNPHAYVRYPGVFGLIRDIFELPNQLANHQEPGLIAGHTNPVIQQGLEQVANKDFFTGKNIHEGGGFGLKDRADFLAKSTIGGSAEGKFANGNKSTAEKIANFFGYNTPHVKGAPAAPGQPWLNQDGAKAASGDPTGIDQAQAYGNAKNQVMNSLQVNDQNTVSKYINRDKDQDGHTLLRGPKTAEADAKDLFANDAARRGVQAIERANASHDPQWDLPDKQLKTWMNYNSLPPGGGDQEAMKQANPWIRDLEANRAAYFNSNQFKSTAVNDPNDPPVPYTLTSGEGKLMGQAGAIKDPQQKTQFYQDHPELAIIDNKYGQYINAKRVAVGLQPIPLLGPPDAKTQADLIALGKVPLGGGSQGGNKYRAQFIQAHPDVSNYLGQSALASVLRMASLSQAGGTIDQSKFYKDIAALGYDIVKNKDGTYSFSPGQGGKGFTQKVATPKFRVPDVDIHIPRVQAGHAKRINIGYHLPHSKVRPMRFPVSKTRSSGGGSNMGVKTQHSTTAKSL